MATISSMTNNTMLLYRMAQNNGMSLLGTSSSNRSTGTLSLSSLYSSSGSSDMGSLQSIRSGYSNLVGSYDTTKKQFNAEMNANLADLSKSTSALKNMSYDFNASDITTNADGTKKYSDRLQAAIKNVETFVKDYNENLSFFNEHSDVSSRASGLAKDFASTTYRADQLADIGVSVNLKTGKLSVDTDQLAKSLVDSSTAMGKIADKFGARYASGPNRVENALGQNGLAGLAERNVQLAQFQGDHVFPSMQSMLGGETRVANLYNGRTLGNMSTYTLAGNLLNMMF